MVNIPEHLHEAIGESRSLLIPNAEPQKIQVLVPAKQFQTVPGTETLQVAWDDIDLLKVLNVKPAPLDIVEHFPNWLQSLNGTRVRIRGFMYPTFEATGLSAFTLVRRLNIMNFVRQTRIDEVIAIRLADGVTADYIESRLFDVEGIFRIEPKTDGKELSHLYRIENARIIPFEKQP